MSEKKQNFLQGTAMLAMATAIVKVIGALYKIPLNAIIGTQGFGYYSTAYEIYAVLLMISTAGLPVAMSRMISQASALDHNNQVRRIYTTCRTIFLTLGISGSLLMTVFCRQLAAFQNNERIGVQVGIVVGNIRIRYGKEVIVQTDLRVQRILGITQWMVAPFTLRPSAGLPPRLSGS